MYAIKFFAHSSPANSAVQLTFDWFHREHSRSELKVFFRGKNSPASEEAPGPKQQVTLAFISGHIASSRSHLPRHPLSFSSFSSTAFRFQPSTFNNFWRPCIYVSCVDPVTRAQHLVAKVRSTRVDDTSQYHFPRGVLSRRSLFAATLDKTRQYATVIKHGTLLAGIMSRVEARPRYFSKHDAASLTLNKCANCVVDGNRVKRGRMPRDARRRRACGFFPSR